MPTADTREVPVGTRARDLMLCEKTGSTINDSNRFMYTGEEYIKSESEMLEVFPGYQEVINITNEVLNRILYQQLPISI